MRCIASGLSLRIEGYYKGFDDLIVGRLETEEERLERISRYDFPPEFADSIPTEAQITSNAINGSEHGEAAPGGQSGDAGKTGTTGAQEVSSALVHDDLR